MPTLGAVPRYRADGTSVDAPPAESGEQGASLGQLLSNLPSPTPTATALVTPVIRQPEVRDLAAASVPGPEAGEQIVAVAGSAIPPDPLQPITMTLPDGSSTPVRVQDARVEVWGGVFNDPQGGWVPAPASLLWPGTRVYLQATPTDGAGDGTLDATRVRIVGEPSAERVKQVDVAEVRDSVAANSAVALLGSQTQPGLYLLNGDRKAQQLWQFENSAAWVNGDPNAGFILREPQAAGGLSTFTWVRNDGTGLQFFAQPYHTVQGVAGDAYGGLWWIETPQATMDQWQLWHYDPATATVALRLQATGKLFTANDESTRRTPILRAVQPVIPGDVSNVILYVDTVDTERQTPYAGFYRLGVQTDGSGTAKVSDGPKLLLGEGQYRGPLVVSPDLTRLAYFAYDPAVPSLTSGGVKPANRLNLLTLPGRGESAAQPVYKTETRFEFLSPDVTWLANDQLLAARGRFAAGGTDLDQFGIVQVQLPPADASADGTANGTGNGAIAANSYLLPRQQSLVDFAACLDGTALLLTRDLDGGQALARWQGGGQSYPLFGLPSQLDRTQLCWQTAGQPGAGQE